MTLFCAIVENDEYSLFGFIPRTGGLPESPRQVLQIPEDGKRLVVLGSSPHRVSCRKLGYMPDFGDTRRA
jgi:hypothetical protein